MLGDPSQAREAIRQQWGDRPANAGYVEDDRGKAFRPHRLGEGRDQFEARADPVKKQQRSGRVRRRCSAKANCQTVDLGCF